jgi:hypothetical protein
MYLLAEPTTRIELVTSSLPRTRSGQLSYVGDPTYVIFEFCLLHLSWCVPPGFQKILPSERETGFEPATSSLEG